MAEVNGRNVAPNFNYSIQALVFFLDKLKSMNKILFRKFEKDLKIVIQIRADLQFVNKQEQFYMNLFLVIFKIIESTFQYFLIMLKNCTLL